MSYAPFAVFNLVCPVMALIYGFTGFAQKPLEQPAAEPVSA